MLGSTFLGVSTWKEEKETPRGSWRSGAKLDKKWRILSWLNVSAKKIRTNKSEMGETLGLGRWAESLVVWESGLADGMRLPRNCTGWEKGSLSQVSCWSTYVFARVWYVLDVSLPIVSVLFIIKVACFVWCFWLIYRKRPISHYPIP